MTKQSVNARGPLVYLVIVHVTILSHFCATITLTDTDGISIRDGDCTVFAEEVGVKYMTLGEAYLELIQCPHCVGVASCIYSSEGCTENMRSFRSLTCTSPSSDMMPGMVLFELATGNLYTHNFFHSHNFVL